MIIDELITDRTSRDLENDTDKAYIDYKDLNRVEEACAYLAGILGVSIKIKVWSIKDFRSQTEMDRVLDNINTLRKAFFTKESTPKSPYKITYTSIYQANDIEAILKDISDMYENMVSGTTRLRFKLNSKNIGNRR